MAIDDVLEPEVKQETHYPVPHSVQIELTIAVDLLILHFDRLTGCYIESDTNYKVETLSFDLHLLEDPVQAYEILSPILTRLQMNPASFTFDDIIRQGLSIGNRVSNLGYVWSNSVQMSCFHIFHVTCMQQWLKQNHYCSICRFEMPISEASRN